jgi:hypothetical protein
MANQRAHDIIEINKFFRLMATFLFKICVCLPQGHMKRFNVIRIVRPKK